MQDDLYNVSVKCVRRVQYDSKFLLFFQHVQRILADIPALPVCHGKQIHCCVIFIVSHTPEFVLQLCVVSLVVP